MTLSVVIVTYNEEANIGRTLGSVQPLVGDGRGEIIVVDSRSSDRTVEIARSFGAKVFVEAWKGYAAQKNSALEKATGEWILSLDADEEVEPELATAMLAPSQPFELGPGERSLRATLEKGEPVGFWVPRKNFFLNRWIRHGGFWPDPKLRLFRRGQGRFAERAVHETLQIDGDAAKLSAGSLVHHSYPTLSDYIDHMNHYSSLAAEMAVRRGPRDFSLVNIVVRPALTFVYNYFFRLGFLDGREGLLLHLYHAVYVSWKYAKAWEAGANRGKGSQRQPTASPLAEAGAGQASAPQSSAADRSR